MLPALGGLEDSTEPTPVGSLGVDDSSETFMSEIGSEETEIVMNGYTQMTCVNVDANLLAEVSIEVSFPPFPFLLRERVHGFLASIIESFDKKSMLMKMRAKVERCIL